MTFTWTDKCQEVFEELKKRLTDAPILWHPAAYYSKSMSDAECNYEIHDKEILVIIRALQEWHAELEGPQLRERFDIYTDHRALEYFMTTKKLNAREARWAEFLS